MADEGDTLTGWQALLAKGGLGALALFLVYRMATGQAEDLATIKSTTAATQSDVSVLKNAVTSLVNIGTQGCVNQFPKDRAAQDRCFAAVYNGATRPPAVP